MEAAAIALIMSITESIPFAAVRVQAAGECLDEEASVRIRQG
jgi:hypothetical protein